MSENIFDASIRNIELIIETMDILGVSDCEEMPEKIRNLQQELGSKSYAAGQALTEIAGLFGEPKWDYPLQVYRLIVKQRDDFESLRSVAREVVETHTNETAVSLYDHDKSVEKLAALLYQESQL